MSSSLSSMLDIVLTVSSSLCTSFSVGSSRTRFSSMPWSRLMVCKGWRKSWLAAARKRDLPILARSASDFAASSALPSRFTSVTSTIATRILRFAEGSSRSTRALIENARRPKPGNSISTS